MDGGRLLTVIGVPAHMRGQRRGFAEALSAYRAHERPMSDMALQVPQHLLPT